MALPFGQREGKYQRAEDPLRTRPTTPGTKQSLPDNNYRAPACFPGSCPPSTGGQVHEHPGWGSACLSQSSLGAATASPGFQGAVTPRGCAASRLHAWDRSTQIYNTSGHQQPLGYWWDLGEETRASWLSHHAPATLSVARHLFFFEVARSAAATDPSCSCLCHFPGVTARVAKLQHVFIGYQRKAWAVQNFLAEQLPALRVCFPLTRRLSLFPPALCTLACRRAVPPRISQRLRQWHTPCCWHKALRARGGAAMPLTLPQGKNAPPSPKSQPAL